MIKQALWIRPGAFSYASERFTYKKVPALESRYIFESPDCRISYTQRQCIVIL